MKRIYGILFFLVCALGVKAYAAADGWFEKAFPVPKAGLQTRHSAVSVNCSANVICAGDSTVLTVDHSRYGEGVDMRFSWYVAMDGEEGMDTYWHEISYTLHSQNKGEYAVCAVVSDAGVEIGRDTVKIYVTEIPSFAPVNDTVCYGMEATVSVDGDGRYWAWSTGGTNRYTNVRPGADSVYYFRVSHYPVTNAGYTNTCYAEDSALVKVFDSAQFAIEGPEGVCKDIKITYTVTNIKPGEDVWWNGVKSGDAAKTLSFTEDTVLKVIATDRYGCRDIKTKPIEVIERPEGEIHALVDGEYSDEVCLGTPVRLEAYSSTGVDRMRWYTRDTADFIEVVPKVDFTAYCDMFVGDDNTCFARIEKHIKVEDCFKVYFATGFKPGGFTPVFAPIGVKDTNRTYELRIFSPNGTMVYSSQVFEDGWDGNYKGKPAPAGVYAYLLIQKYEQFVWTRRGTFTLIR